MGTLFDLNLLYVYDTFNISLFVFFLWIKTAIFKNYEHEVRFECDECFMALQNVALFLSKADNSSERTIK